MRPLLIVLALASVASLVRTAHAQDDPCPCEMTTPPSPYGETIALNGFDFTWRSDANDTSTATRRCFERSVVNNDKSSALRFDWIVGRMKSEVLAPKGTARKCSYYGEQTTRKGPLNYGRGSDSTPTRVWEGTDEPEPPGGLFTVLTVDGLVGTETYPVAVAFTSNVAVVSGRVEYKYELYLLPGSKPAVVDWPPADLVQRYSHDIERPGSSHASAMSAKSSPKKTIPSLLELLSQEKPRPFTLSGDQKIRISKTLVQPFVVASRDVVLRAPNGTILLTAEVTAYEPRREEPAKDGKRVD